MPFLSLMVLLVATCALIALVWDVGYYAFCVRTHTLESPKAIEHLVVSGGVFAFLGLLTVPLLGFARIGAFHPAFSPQYRDYLELTPYDGKRPLPLGAVGFVWQDILVLGVIGFGLAAYQRIHGGDFVENLYFAGVLGTGAYLTLALAALFGSGKWFYGYILLFGYIPAVISGSVVASLVVQACLLVFAMWATASTLGSLPSRREAHEATVQTYTVARGPSMKLDVLDPWTRLGWPYHCLPNPPAVVALGRRHAVLLSAWATTAMIAAMWLGGLGDLELDEDEITLTLFSGFFLGISALGVSLFIGCFLPLSMLMRHSPNRTLLGRLRSGVLIIPAYDRALLPVVYVVCALLFGWRLGAISPYLLPFLYGFVPLLTHLAVPDPQRFMLTAPVVLRAPRLASERFERL